MILFEIDTPIGLHVTATHERWNLIAGLKHPVMRGREEDVRVSLRDPHEIRQSTTDRTVLLFYRLDQPRRWICAVVKKVDNEQGFLVTAYPTDAIKEGKKIWTK